MEKDNNYNESIGSVEFLNFSISLSKGIVRFFSSALPFNTQLLVII